MKQTQLLNQLPDQSKDQIWIIDPVFHLIYANKRYLHLMKDMTMVAKKLNQPVLVEGTLRSNS
jgi:hypothetical protein